MGVRNGEGGEYLYSREMGDRALGLQSFCLMLRKLNHLFQRISLEWSHGGGDIRTRSGGSYLILSKSRHSLGQEVHKPEGGCFLEWMLQTETATVVRTRIPSGPPRIVSRLLLSISGQ